MRMTLIAATITGMLGAHRDRLHAITPPRLHYIPPGSYTYRVR